MNTDNGREKNGYFLFWSGVFSQWYPSKFKIKNIEYNCAEQFMMAEKARLFKDKNVFKLIMKSKNPREQKKLGRQVENFDENIWNNKCREIVFQGNLAKFSQNEGLYNELMATNNLTMVESSPYDTVWGIGLAANDPDATNPGKWRGKNLLGQAIQQVREHLKSVKENLI